MTEKQMRRHLFRIWYRWGKLQNALNDAHNAGLIEYPKDENGHWPKDTCCNLNWRLRESIEKYTKDRVAEIVQREIRSQV